MFSRKSGKTRNRGLARSQSEHIHILSTTIRSGNDAGDGREEYMHMNDLRQEYVYILSTTKGNPEVNQICGAYTCLENAKQTARVTSWYYDVTCVVTEVSLDRGNRKTRYAKEVWRSTDELPVTCGACGMQFPQGMPCPNGYRHPRRKGENHG